MRKATWIIGGDSGIGLSIADLLREDVSVRTVIATSAADCDVRVKSDIEKILTKISDMNPDFVEVVYCAGVNYLENLGHLNMDAVENLLNVNLTGFIRVVDQMTDWNFQNVRMVVIGSDAAERPMRTSIAYCASKAALHMAARVAARELADRNWRVNVVAPGMTDGTGMTHYVDATVMEVRGWTRLTMLDYEMQQAVVKRRAFPGEIARVIDFVLTAPDYMNGSIIKVNGGR